jgi:hypothetical protein
VCLTWEENDGKGPRIVDRSQAKALFESFLKDPSAILVGHNLAYDMAVLGESYPELLPPIFQAYEEDRATCTMLRQMLLDIASGTYRRKHVGKGIFREQRYDLESLAQRCAGMRIQKDAWRLSYGEFLHTPLAQWEERAHEVQMRALDTLTEKRRLYSECRAAKVRADDKSMKALAAEIQGLEDLVSGPANRCTEYPLEDARATLAIYLAQEKHSAWLADQFRQARAYFALQLESAWGLKTAHDAVDIYRSEVSCDFEEVEQILSEAGIVREDGSRDMKAAKRRMIWACREEGIRIPRTDGHAEEGKCKKLDGTRVPDGSDECEEHVCMDGDACDVSEDEVMQAYGLFSKLRKIQANDLEALSKGEVHPIHSRFGLAETGRTTSSKPNIQNWVRARKCRVCEGKGEVAA